MRTFIGYRFFPTLMTYMICLLCITFSICGCSTKTNYEEQDSNTICKKMSEIMERDQRFRGSEELFEENVSIQNELDIQNTKDLLQITKAKGWPTKIRLNCEKSAPVVIFRHSPEPFWDEIKIVIEKEYKAKRMTEGDYKFILNHINGRPLDLDIDGVEIIIK